MRAHPTQPLVLWVALSIGLLTHGVYAALDHDHYAIDTPSYLVPADNLIHGNGYVNALQEPELRRTPGYPLLLAGFRIRPLRLEYLIRLQHAFCVLIVVGASAVAWRYIGHRAALVTAVVLSVDFATLRIANLLMTEITSSVLIAGAAWATYHAMTKPQNAVRASAFAGLLGGCGALVRPVGIFYLVPMSLCLILAQKRRALGPVLVLIAAFLLFPLLWATRNYIQAGYFGLSTIGAEDLLYYRAAGALAIEQPGSYLANAARINLALDEQTCPDLESQYHRDCSRVSEAEKASYAIKKGKSIILAHPFSYLRSSLLSLGYIVFGGGAEALSKVSSLSLRASEIIVLLFTIPEACLALIGCWYWYRREPHLCYVLVLTVAYFLLISAGAEAYSRFRVPIMPMYSLLIAGGAASIAQFMARSETRKDRDQASLREKSS
jgi:hypothetical protein